MAKKFYVVWVGREIGVFDNWSYTKAQVDQYPKAKYKSFKTKAEADIAFARGSGGVVVKSVSASITAKKTAKSTSASKVDQPSLGGRDVTIYCDGGCDPNPGRSASGVAVYLGVKLVELWYGLYNPQGTNNTAELNALHQALLIAQEASEKGQSVQVLCDSQYAINCVTNWAYSWKQKGWKRKTAGDIKNLAIIQDAHALYDKIRSGVDVLHVRAHIGIEGNELADRMSIYGIAQEDPEFCRYSGSLNIQEILDLRAG